MRIWIRALRRADVPLVFSQGHHAHPRFAAGPPLSLGFTSLAEYADIEVNQRLPNRFLEVINGLLPEGITLTRFMEIVDKKPSLNDAITHATYSVRWKHPLYINGMQERIDDFMRLNSYRVKRFKKGVEREVDIRLFVDRIECKRDSVEMLLRLTPRGTVRVQEVVDAIAPHYEDSVSGIRVVRTGLYIEERGDHMSPMDAK
jgi:radical SAM-linked protein